MIQNPALQNIFASGQWKEQQGIQPDKIKEKLEEIDVVKNALKKHPEIIKVIADTFETWGRRNQCRHRVMYGRWAKDMLHLEALRAVTANKASPIMDAYLRQAEEGLKRELEDANLSLEGDKYVMKEHISDMKTADGTPIMDLDSETFFTKLLAHQEAEHWAYVNGYGGHYMDNPHDSQNPYYLSPAGVSIPQYNQQNQFQQYQTYPGHYYGDQNGMFPPQPHQGLQGYQAPQPHSSSTLDVLTGLGKKALFGI